eukprot:819573_1
MTASLRFEGELNVDLNEFQNNLVPFPRLHFIITSMAPVVTPKKAETTRQDIQGITETCFSAQNFFTKFCPPNPYANSHLSARIYIELLISMQKRINTWLSL